ncbi:hypothetical protein EV363DRAFT_1335658 [Boletus edulis]|nr:hypothetical protein EV363DRAFT_1335658 [Boletus edulis]
MSTLHPALAIIRRAAAAAWGTRAFFWEANLDHEGNLTTQQQYLQAGVETLLILEQSFYLSQQGDPDAVSSAAQEYKTSDIPTKVNVALKDVFTHYASGTASKNEKVDMICNIITQNHMERPVAR